MNETTLERVIWEEENLIEQKKKSESNGEQEASVITIKTQMPLESQSEKIIRKKEKENEKARRKYARRMADPIKRVKLQEKNKKKYERLMADPVRREKLRASKRKYFQSEHGKANLKKYASSLKSKEARKQYRLSSNGKLKRANYKKIHYFITLAQSLRSRNKNGHRITANELWSIAKKQKLICPLTGRKLTRENISLDHITPLSAGGDNSFNNLRFVDYHANLAKLNYSDVELLQLAKDIVSTLGS